MLCCSDSINSRL